MVAIASSNTVFIRLAYIVYMITFFFLLVVMGYGIITSGAQRWIKIGSISFQPSEFVKISLILALAKVFPATRESRGLSLRDLSLPIFDPSSTHGFDP